MKAVGTIITIHFASIFTLAYVVSIISCVFPSHDHCLIYASLLAMAVYS